MRKHIIGGLALILGAVVTPMAAHAVTVNCAAGKKIADALAQGATDIKVVGTCNENVVIRRDDVTIEGNSGAKVVGSLLIDGANRITIKKLIVQGAATPADAGILIDRGGAAVLDHVTVRGMVNGIDTTGNSYVEIVNGSLVEHNSGEGIVVQLGSGGVVKDSTSSNNGDVGVDAIRGGSLWLTNNNFVDNGDTQVFAGEQGNVFMSGNTLTGHGTQALRVIRNSAVRLRGGNTLTSVDGFASIWIDLGSTLAQSRAHDVVNGRLIVSRSSNARFEDVEINPLDDSELSNDSILDLTGPTTILNGSLGIQNDSALFIDDQVSITGSVYCADTESSVSAPDPNGVVGGIACDGF